jgi:PAS domain S-box-containing protein
MKKELIVNNDKLLTAEAAELRRQAEELLGKRVRLPLAGAETQRLVHELEVHQVELEMQNEVLRQARDDLEKALDKYAGFYDFAPVSYFTLDHEGVVNTVNLSGARLLGMERSWLPGKYFGLFVAVEDRTAFAGFLEKVFVSQCKESCEVTLLSKENHPLFVQIEAVAVASGQECFVAVIDITARRQIEAELKQTNKQKELILALAGEGIIGLDLKGNHTFVNASAAAMLGYEVNELVAKQSHSTWHYARPDGTRYPAEKCPIYAAYKDGSVHSGEELFLRKDGTAFPVLFTSRPIIVNGAITGAVLTFNDITEHKRMEGELRESEERFRATFDQSAMGIGHVGPDGRILRINRKYCEILGYSEEELKALTIQDITHPDDREESMNYFRQMLEGKCGSYSLEKRYIRKDGSTVWVTLTVSTVVDTGGNLRFGVGIVEDITDRKRAEETLRFSEERYRALFHYNPTMIVTLDAELTLLSVNPACAAQLGYTIDELEGQSVLKLFQQADQPAVIEQLQMCLRNPEQVYHWQFRKVRKDGKQLWVEETAQAVSDLNGVLNLLVVCQDITARKQAEEERETLLVQLDAVLNSINEGVVIADLSGNILTMNPSALAFHEYASVEQVRGSYQLLDTFELTDLEGRTVPFEQWPLSRALRGERFTDVEVYVRRNDSGSSRIGSYSGTPVQTQSGDVILAVVTVRDITERKRAEAEIQRLASFPLMNPNPVLELDADGRMTFCNPAAKKILEKGGYVTGINPFIPQGLSLILQDLRVKKADQFCREIEINGSYFEELIYVTPPFKSVRIYTMDVTARRRMEEEIERLNSDLAARAAELESANRELEAFNYSVAHDLRRPLTVINGFCQAISEICSDKLDEACKGYLLEAYNGTLQMNRLIDSLLNFSRMAHAEPRRTMVNLSAIVHEIAAELKLTEPGRKVTFRIADRVSAKCDANLLRVVLDNLLSNAWKYNGTKDEEIIEFGKAEADGKVVYFVRDNGAGFDPADANKLFAPFQRLPGAEGSKGFGIGLATVERIIRRHGGKIWAEGEPGKGATFYFTL